MSLFFVFCPPLFLSPSHVGERKGKGREGKGGQRGRKASKEGIVKVCKTRSKFQNELEKARYKMIVLKNFIFLKLLAFYPFHFLFGPLYFLIQVDVIDLFYWASL